MKVLIVHAHPEHQSFCSSLASHAQSWFLQHGHDVERSDLYALGFDPVGSPKDFTSLENPSYFKYKIGRAHV